MKKAFMFLAVLLIVITWSGCSESEPEKYVSKRGEYSVTYPGNWGVEDDKEEINKMRKDSPLGLPFNPDVIFSGGDNLGAMVVRMPMLLPGVTSENFISYYQKMEKRFGLPIKDSRIRRIRGQKFRVGISETFGGGQTLSAVTYYRNYLYNFQFYTSKEKMKEWKPKFDAYISTISFGRQDLSQTTHFKTMDKAGFFTGLWHGLLLPFRVIFYFFSDIEIYAQNNTGTGYLIGFILGSMGYVLGGSRRKG